MAWTSKGEVSSFFELLSVEELFWVKLILTDKRCELGARWLSG